MSYADVQYHKLLEELVHKMEGTGLTENRTEISATNIFGYQMRFDLAKGFPILTTKSVHFKSVLVELLWFLKGDTNIKYLLENNVHIWTDWRFKEFKEHCESTGQVPPEYLKEFEKNLLDGYIDDKWGDIGKGYGHQWRKFGEQYSEYDDDYGEVVKDGFDQISWVINEIKTNPNSRRLIVSGWNPHEVDKVDLPPCHTLFQFFVEPRSNKEMIEDWESKMGRTFKSQYNKDVWKSAKGFQEYLLALMKADGIRTSKLSCQLYQRSADVFLGVPFNIASYALLTHMVAQTCGLEVGEFIWTGGVTHLYGNHYLQAKEQLTRDVNAYEAPKLLLNPEKEVLTFNINDVELQGYESFPSIKAEVAV